MDDNREKLKEIFLKNFQNLNSDNFDFNRDRSQFENWDSLTHLQLVSEVENIFGINFEMDEIADINNPEGLMVLIQKKQNG